ncbi:MAG TPA: hypothetical protein IAA80_05770 [Candidatus Gallacutalibacter pullistercoris]|nr:hypothetical protein [Candidatus Gallacutalibacter pullistercoris]
MEELLLWLAKNLNWVVPMVITAIFSALNIRLAVINRKVAENQAQLQNDSFCYQLFERRMAIYTSIKETISTVMTDSTASIPLINKYLQNTRDALFLFGDEIAGKIDQLYKMMVELRTVSVKLEHDAKIQNTSSAHDKLCERECELLKQISNFGSHLREDFSLYISFGDYRIGQRTVRE